MNKHKYIFFGTPGFAAIVLDKLIAAGWIPAAVVTQPDKPVGRKQILEKPPVKQSAEKNGIPVWQPEKLKNNAEIIEKIRALEPDLLIVAAYGKIIPKDILDIPKFGCLNVHPSLLPKYRGPSPIQTAILNGDIETGVTIMLLDEEVDHGAILARREFSIINYQFSNKSQIQIKLNSVELTKILAKLGADLLIETLPKYLSGEIKPSPQNHAVATYTKIIRKEDGLIDWTKPAEEIERMVRAFHDWPTAFAKINLNGRNKILKIFKAAVLTDELENKTPGKIFLHDKSMAVACGKNSLILEEIQLEGKNKMSGADFLRGYPDIVGKILEK